MRPRLCARENSSLERAHGIHDQRRDATEVQVERHGFVSLIYADVKTDYGARCMTLHLRNKLLTDLTFPAGRLNPDSLLVVVSRAQSLKQIGLFMPLYRTNSERERTTTKSSMTSLRSRVSRKTSY